MFNFDLSKVYAIWLREVKRYINSKSRIISSLGQPLLFLIALGGGMSALAPEMHYQTFLLPGIVAMSILFTSLFAGVSVIWDRDFGFLKEILAAPATRETIVLGRILGGATTALIQGTLILTIGVIITGSQLPSLENTILLYVLMTVLSSFLVAAGIAVASVVQEVETFQPIMNFIIMPLFFLSNALFPIRSMPEWMRAVSTINPISYPIDGMRFLLTGQGYYPLFLDFAISVSILAILFYIATYLFSRTNI